MAHVTLKDVTKIYDGDILAVEQANFEIQTSRLRCLSVLQDAANRRCCG